MSSFKQFDLENYTIPENLLFEIPEEAAEYYKILPLDKKNNVLSVGLVDTNNFKSQEAARFIGQQKGLEIQFYIISPESFEKNIKRYHNLRHEVSQALSAIPEEEEQRKKEKSKTEKELFTEAPISKIVSVIFQHAVEGKASDIHIEPLEERTRVRYRLDGILYTSLLLPKDIHRAIVSRIKVLSNLKLDETRVPQDGRFRSFINKKKIDFRVSTLPTSYGEKVVLRLLDSSTGLLSFDDLGLVGYNQNTINETIKKPFGMILITGPTGSGKSTTLYAVLKILNKEGVNIISLEDPVEYLLEGVNQSQVKPEIHYTFASGLRSILRQDPDIIMVGEIRDEETARLATHAALTGHLVLSTLHTNDAIGVIPRLMDMGVKPFLIPSSLAISASQRLLRRLCPKCKYSIDPPPKIKKMIEDELNSIPEQTRKQFDIPKEIKLWKAKGCPYCSNRGTKGRVAIYETFYMTPELEKIIIAGPTEEKLRNEANRQGMITMKQDGLIKAIQGIVSFEEVMRVIEEE